jgi:hypothetical protein
MATGWPLDKTTMDQKGGEIIVSLQQALLAAHRHKLLLDAQFSTNAPLISLGYTDAEATIYRASIIDAAALRPVAYGISVPGAVNNFFFNGQKLAGIHAIYYG